MDTSKARLAALAVTKKLPADDVLRHEYYVERRGFTEISRRYGTSESAVRQLFANRGWPKERPVDAPVIATPQLCETSAKIVVRREVLVQGREFFMRKIAISLPRIPTLHGHFVAALPSSQGA